MKAPPFTARAAWTLLAILAAARIVAMFPQTMWAWGLNVPRFVSPVTAWLLLGLLAVSLIPPLGRVLEPPLTLLGDLLTRSRVARLGAAVLAALLAWLLVDRLWFLGDFMLRQGAAQGENISTMFRQALPLDFLVHGMGPRTMPSDPATGSLYSRLLGAAEAATLALLALRFPRGLGLGGVAALASAGVVFFGGHLAFYTGFAKAASELVLFTIATVVLGSSLAREGRGGYALGLVLGVAFGFHRMSLLFVPAWLLAWAMWFRRHRGSPGRIGGWIALLLPAMMLARALPEMFRIAREFDWPRHVATADVARQGGPLVAAFAPLRLLDLGNLSLVLAPLGLVGLLWLASSSRRPSIELSLLLTLLLTSLPFLLLIHPQQGIFRDWDVFSPIGAILCMLAALAVGATMRDENASWLAAPAMASALVPTLLVLLLHHDVDGGLRRVHAFVHEAPTRPDVEQASVWDFLGLRAFRLANWDLAAEAFTHCDRYEPTRRVRITWAICETMRGNYAGAARVYSRILVADDHDPVAWLGLGGAAKRMGDEVTFTRAARRLDGFMHDDTSAKEIRKFLGYFPQAWPADSASADSLR